MNSNIDNETMYITPEHIMTEWGVSRATAYNIIKDMKKRISAEHPNALIVPGKVNRLWYDEACLKTTKI